MLVDIHMLQNYAPSNLNRDDTGAPKDAIFGNTVRARISSQAIKRSIRRSEVFAAAFRDAGLLATRTRRLPALLSDRLAQNSALDADAVALIVKRSREIGRESGRESTTEGEEPETAQLIFLSDAEVDELADRLAALYQEQGAKSFAALKPDELSKAVRTTAPRSDDIAMFGRMTTSAAFDDVQAAVQVAHAISTHKVEQEFDYYTAVDDISGESGAGFIGDVAFNSATFYKYISVHWEGLVANLGGDTDIARQAVAALIEAAATVSPTGKQNTFAAHNLPDFVLVEARDRNLPISYANAFLRPVWSPPTSSMIDESVNALASYVNQLTSTYPIPAERAWFGTGNWTLDGAERLPNLPALLEWLPLADRATV
jgi:CRISPR system Cascade subunit CasC